MKLFVGIDPGIVETAIVSIGATGREVITKAAIMGGSAKNEPRGFKRLRPERLRLMMRGVQCEIDTILAFRELKDAFFAIEEPFVGVNGATALKTYAVFACTIDWLQCMAENRKIRGILTVPPTTLKKFVGAKKKESVARQAYKLWRFESDDNNIVDAYAIAMWARDQFAG